MFTAEQYRATAIEYSKLLTTANSPDEVREYRRLKQSFAELADNAQWRTQRCMCRGESLVIVLLVGLIAGWLAGQIVQGTGFGIVGDMLIGIIGSFIGSWLIP
jgi:F0F1-type ATP synthase assembly protein I